MDSAKRDNDSLEDSSQEGRYRQGKVPQAGGGGKVCGVCGDRASAHNFGALTCETCKAFFRRNANKEESPRCMFDNHCIIDRTTRKQCAACRLKKCFSIGMKPQLILDDSAKKARMMMRQKKRAEREEVVHQNQDWSMVGGQTPAATTAPSQNMSSSASTFSTDAANSHTAATVPSVGAGCPVPNSTMSQTGSGTADSPAVPSLSPSGVATSPMGSATPFNASGGMSTSGAAVDVIFQQALADMDLSSQEVRCTAPSAAGLWAKPSASQACEGNSSWSHPEQSMAFREMGSTQDRGSSCFSLSQDGSNAAQLQQPSSLKPSDGFGFQHVPREDLPSDMKQYWLLTSDERATLTQLTSAYQDTMMKLTDRDPDKRLSLGSSGGITLEDFFYVVEQVLHLCVRFAKALPDFWQLKQPDQIAILKTSSMQCDGIALSAMCVPERSVWQTPFGDLGMNHMPAALNTARDRELMAEMLSFSRQLKSVAKSDITIYGLLHCIALFDPSEATLDDKQLVNTLKDKYLILLKHYIESQFSYQHADRYLGELMEALRKLRALSQQSVLYLKQFSSFFNPLGVEFFDLD